MLKVKASLASADVSAWAVAKADQKKGDIDNVLVKNVSFALNHEGDTFFIWNLLAN